MTSDDRFDRRFGSGVADLAAPRFPDYFDDVLAETGRTRQRPAWTFPGRWIPMVDIAQGRAIAPRAPLRALAIIVAVLLMLAALAAAYVGSQRRLPAPFGVARNGVIAHTDAAGGIYVTDPLTGGTRRIVADTTGAPLFSLDGTKVAFERRVETSVDVYVANADGSGELKLTKTPIDSFAGATWSPDGKMLAIGYSVGPEDNQQGRIDLVRTDGSGATRLDLGLDSVWGAKWRPPDGTDLLVTGAKDGRDALLLVRPDGTNLRSLGAPGATDAGYGVWAATWSPDGSRIAYTIYEESGASIHVINADGSGHVALPKPDDARDQDPTWSPDGKHVAVFRSLDLPDNTIDGSVAILPADGSGAGIDAVRTNSTDASGGNITGGLNWTTTWSPDGSQVIATLPIIQKVVAIDAATGQATPLDWKTNEVPDWQRLAP
jgi:Tol biopolymer transport system component